MKIFKNRIFQFILTAVFFTSITAITSVSLAIPNDKAISSIETKPANNDNVVDNYANKPYIRDGLSIYDNRITILDGGYYRDENNVTWVNLTVETNKTIEGNTSSILIYNLPSTTKKAVFSDINQEYAFKFNYNSSYQNNITYFDRDETSIPAHTQFTIQFKY